MKRKTFVISYNGKQIAKSAWNACIREIEKIAREMAQAEGVVYHLTGSETLKDEYKNCIKGFRRWNDITFSIEVAA